MVSGLDTHKASAVSPYHAAMAKKGEERARLMAKAQEHTWDFVAKAMPRSSLLGVSQ